MVFFQECLLCYEWVRTLIKTETGVDIKKKSKRRKKPIPKKIKRELWDKLIGREKGIAKCLCCNNIEISKDDFDAGHIIPESKGGNTNIDNLRPICRACNSSMGQMNMDDYIKKYYSK